MDKVQKYNSFNIKCKSEIFLKLGNNKIRISPMVSAMAFAFYNTYKWSSSNNKFHIRTHYIHDDTSVIISIKNTDPCTRSNIVLPHVIKRFTADMLTSWP
jgi:hypothetical protein